MIPHLLEDLRKRDILIWAEAGRIRYDAAPGALTPEVVGRLREHREEILRHLERDGDLPDAAQDAHVPSGPEGGGGGEIRLRPLLREAGGAGANGTGTARAVVFVLPPAGAGPAMFQRWREEVPADLDVVLVHAPGREERLEEAAYTHVAPLADRVAEAVGSYDDRAFVLLGHSAGALVAREVARRVGSPRLRLLAVAGSPAPDAVTGDEAEADDGTLLDAMAAWGGTPGEILADPDACSVFLPCLRADLSVVASCRKSPEARERLDIPVIAFSGTEDQVVTHEEMRDWRHWTDGSFRIHRVPGGHFFPVTSGAAIFASITRALDDR
ncbi:alpha/beta fold hydrolase [Streptomyces daliensis]|uniref:Alpha/beta fold hydrolase n=1 Tax=Streptomyces daliensis TaxID=299421 RepID=A0A8T4ITV3_9ACTN|nr:alpha/beta fold hydrolase [Streptomyces daliensis]